MHPKPARNLAQIFRQLGTLSLGFAFGRLYQRLADRNQVQASKDLNRDSVHLNEEALNHQWEQRNK